MYTESPQNTITLSEFEELALERLQLLRFIEQASLKGHKQFSEDWKLSIKDDLVKNGLRKYLTLWSGHNGQTEQHVQARRADHLSHYILRLAYCMTEISLDVTDFYKVPFGEVVPLVKNRRVFLLGGHAYVPMNDLVFCLQSKFRAILSEALN
ncbi:hypothetical protein NQ318_005491, partial [Aromia moschata]